MEHDPLCPYRDGPKWNEQCPQCDLNAKVRADERAKGMAEDRWISAREAREYEADIRADERALIVEKARDLVDRFIEHDPRCWPSQAACDCGLYELADALDDLEKR